MCWQLQQQPVTSSTHCQVSVNDGNCQVECLLEETELEMDLDEPVNQDAPHPLIHFRLVLQEGRTHVELLLHLEKVAVDVLDVLGTKLRVVIVILVDVIEAELLLEGFCHGVDIHCLHFCFVAHGCSRHCVLLDGYHLPHRGEWLSL